MTHHQDTPIYSDTLDEALGAAIIDGNEELGELLLDMDERTAPKQVTAGLAERQTIGPDGRKVQSLFPKRTRQAQR